MSDEIRNYTTSINHMKTISEIEHILAKHGAIGIRKDYEDGNVSSLYFQAQSDLGKITFKLPAEIDKTRELLIEGKKNGNYKGISKSQARSIDHARNVAWRVIKDWVDAQLTLLRIGMTKIEQVFLPYAYDPTSGKTLFDKMEEGGFSGLLEA